MHYTKSYILQLLNDYSSIAIFVDCRYKDVLLPSELIKEACSRPEHDALLKKRRGYVHLNVGLYMYPAIHDLLITENWFSGTLNFFGKPFYSKFPLKAIDVIGVYKGNNLVPPYSDVPNNVVNLNDYRRRKGVM